VGNKQVIGDAPDVAGDCDAGWRRLGVAPYAIDDGGLKRGRAAKLESQVPREPGGGNDIHLLADPYCVGRYHQRYGRLSSRRWRSALQKGSESGVERGCRDSRVRLDVHHERLIALRGADRTNLPPSGP
jgi:hypothetical protein